LYVYRVVFNYFVLTETRFCRQKGILRTTQPPNRQWRSPRVLPDAERSEEGLSRGSGSEKLPEEKDGEKLPEGGDAKLPKETPTGKLIKPCTDRVLLFCS
jgi:hypothetical protein